MRRINLRFIRLACIFFVLIALPQLTANAGGKKDSKSSKGSKNSIVVVQRVDNNNLIRLRVFIDGKTAGTLKVGETSVYKVSNGPHTLYAGFEDYQARSTEVTQFTADNSRFIFTVTDESLVMIGHERLSSEEKPVVVEAPPIVSTEAPAEQPRVNTLEAAVHNSFENATEKLKKKSKVAVVNVDAEDVGEATYVLEELTYLAVHSPKKFTVIDRRMIDAFRASNGAGVPSYNNDYILMLIGRLVGADTVISGRLDGANDLRRLRVKALDVKSGMLVGNASEHP
jgi:hypothetical protein